MENLLLEIGGKELYFDIDRLSDVVKIEPGEIPQKLEGDMMEGELQEEGALQIDITKYEMYREMISTILGYGEEIDDKMGFMGLSKTTIPFKMAYNTLLMKGIIKEL